MTAATSTPLGRRYARRTRGRIAVLSILTAAVAASAALDLATGASNISLATVAEVLWAAGGR